MFAPDTQKTPGGIIAGVTTVTIVNPVWVIKTRLQLHTGGAGSPAAYRGSWDVLRQLLREEGVAGLYKGLIPSIWGVSETAIQFVLYERIKATLASRQEAVVNTPNHGSSATASQASGSAGAGEQKKSELRNVEYVGAAASAKLVASCVTYPHEVVRTRLRERGADQIYSSAIHCVRRIWMEEGARGLYGGLGTHLLRVVPNTAILFFTYEKVAKFLADIDSAP